MDKLLQEKCRDQILRAGFVGLLVIMDTTSPAVIGEKALKMRDVTGKSVAGFVATDGRLVLILLTLPMKKSPNLSAK